MYRRTAVWAAAALALSAAGVLGVVDLSVARPAQATNAAHSAHDSPAVAGSKDLGKGEALVKASDCLSCHAVDHKLVGPAFQEVAGKYAGQGSETIPTLVAKIQKGGSGNWGEIVMTPHPDLSDADATTMVRWILSEQPATSAKPTGTDAAAGKVYTYKASDGKPVKTDFQVFTDAKQSEVTPGMFSGYEQYNSYCYRCHGNDAVGGEFAPDLRHSLSAGMTWEQFLSTAMAGRPAKGMPSWAGFFEESEIRDIYDYVKARQLELVQPGRPPSAQD